MVLLMVQLFRSGTVLYGIVPVQVQVLGIFMGLFFVSRSVVMLF